MSNNKHRQMYLAEWLLLITNYPLLITHCSLLIDKIWVYIQICS